MPDTSSQMPLMPLPRTLPWSPYQSVCSAADMCFVSSCCVSEGRLFRLVQTRSDDLKCPFSTSSPRPPLPAPPSPRTHLARLRIVAPLGQVMGLHLHRAQHPPGLRPHPPLLRPRGDRSGASDPSAGTARVLTGAGPSDRPGSQPSRAPREAAALYSRDNRSPHPPLPALGSPPASPRAVCPYWGAPCGIARRQTSGAGSRSPGT